MLSFPFACLDTAPPRFSPDAQAQGRALLALPPAQLFRRFVTDKESEGMRWAALALIETVLDQIPPRDAPLPDSVAALDERLRARRADLGQRLHAVLERDGRARHELLRERAPVRALSGVWLESVSQPATQPAPLVNRLFRARCLDQQGAPGRQPQWQRHHHVLLDNGLALPELADPAFERACLADTASWLQACFLQSLALYGARCLPEIAGVHWAFHALAVDAAVGGPLDDDAAARDDAAEMFQTLFAQHGSATPGWPRAARAALALAELESLQVQAMLTRLCRQARRNLDERVAEIVARHAPYAGKQHGKVKVDGETLADRFASPDFDPHAFVRAFKASPYVRARDPRQPCRFMGAIQFGGPMFGVFDADETMTLQAWSLQAASPETLQPPANHDMPQTAWDAVLTALPAHPGFDTLAETVAPAPRQFFHRLVNIEQFPAVLPLARTYAEQGLSAAAALLHAPGDGSAWRHTDARAFPYTRDALYARFDAIYHDKLLGPIAPLAEMPDAEEVVFTQKTFALGNLIDGAWAYRSALRGRHLRAADRALFAIYADEMGQGDVAQNHIQLIHQVLRSMDVHLPHIASTDFIEQEELLDEIYPFALYQLCLAQFPDSYRPEILGFNLGIEMFGLGELRLHEIEKLRRWGYDTAYEVTHLSIDNYGSGHARSSLDAVADHLDQVVLSLGPESAAQEWRRIWTGYASFAQFVERMPTPPAAPQSPARTGHAPLHAPA